MPKSRHECGRLPFRRLFLPPFNVPLCTLPPSLSLPLSLSLLSSLSSATMARKSIRDSAIGQKALCAGLAGGHRWAHESTTLANVRTSHSHLLSLLIVVREIGPNCILCIFIRTGISHISHWWLEGPRRRDSRDLFGRNLHSECNVLLNVKCCAKLFFLGSTVTLLN